MEQRRAAPEEVQPHGTGEASVPVSFLCNDSAFFPLTSLIYAGLEL